MKIDGKRIVLVRNAESGTECIFFQDKETGSFSASARGVGGPIGTNCEVVGVIDDFEFDAVRSDGVYAARHFDGTPTFVVLKDNVLYYSSGYAIDGQCIGNYTILSRVGNIPKEANYGA